MGFDGDSMVIHSPQIMIDHLFFVANLFFVTEVAWKSWFKLAHLKFGNNYFGTTNHPIKIGKSKYPKKDGDLGTTLL